MKNILTYSVLFMTVNSVYAGPVVVPDVPMTTGPQIQQPSKPVQPPVSTQPARQLNPDELAGKPASTPMLPVTPTIVPPPQRSTGAKPLVAPPPVDMDKHDKSPKPKSSKEQSNPDIAPPLVFEAKSTATVISGTGKSETVLVGKRSKPTQPESELPFQVSMQTGPTPMVNGFPGLGKPPGAAQPVKPVIIRSQPGANDIVYVSSRYPNRISTPFANPKLVDMSAAEYQVIGNSIYIVPKEDGEPAGIFITGDDSQTSVVSMTLVPKNIPGQNIIVQIEGGSTGKKQSVPDEANSANDYVSQLRALLRSIVRGKIPSGYSEEEVTGKKAMIGTIETSPERRWAGSQHDIYRYKLRNLGAAQITLSEQNFYQKGIKAVAFYPSIQLNQGEDTNVYIVSGKDDSNE